jgi:hypothetical protein
MGDHPANPGGFKPGNIQRLISYHIMQCGRHRVFSTDHHLSYDQFIIENRSPAEESLGRIKHHCPRIPGERSIEMPGKDEDLTWALVGGHHLSRFIPIRGIGHRCEPATRSPGQGRGQEQRRRCRQHSQPASPAGEKADSQTEAEGFDQRQRGNEFLGIAEEATSGKGGDDRKSLR